MSTKFWSVTWGQLAPGDEIQAPDGTVWCVGAAITCDGWGEWEISNAALKVHLWTEQRERNTALARRPSRPELPPSEINKVEAFLVDMLGAERVET